jgi:hypothetical protein
MLKDLPPDQKGKIYKKDGLKKLDLDHENNDN